jgi:DNA polymerase-3 subunit delta
VRSADIFALMDAIGNKNRKQAIELFHDLLSKDDPVQIMGMVIRHFRNLILVKECLNRNFSEKEIQKTLNLRDFVVKKLVTQSRSYTLKELDEIYRKLLEFDVLVKTSQLDVELGIDLLIVDSLPESIRFVLQRDQES